MREDESVEVSVRRAREEDYAEIVEVHCSDVDKWYRYSEGEKIEASYEELTPFERWLHGGPWMDERALRIHFEILRECGGEAFVAVSGGRVVGEAEVVFGEELEPYGRYCFLEVLVVHRDCRRRGVGTKLVEHCIEYARARGYSRFDAVPEDRRSRRLYSKLGLERMSYLCKMEKECKRASPPLSLEETSLEEHPWGMLLVSGHWYPSVYVWQNLARSTEYNRLEGFRLERPRAFEIRDRESDRDPSSPEAPHEPLSLHSLRVDRARALESRVPEGGGRERGVQSSRPGIREGVRRGRRGESARLPGGGVRGDQESRVHEESGAAGGEGLSLDSSRCKSWRISLATRN